MAEKVSGRAASFGMNRGAKCAMKREKHKANREYNRNIDANRVKLSPAEQLKKLDFRLGVGLGARKERLRLLATINK